MATYADNGVEVLAHLPTQSKDDFREIWHLESIQIAKTNEGFWLKGFRQEDLKSPTLQSISKLQLFELKEQFLCKKGNRVPERKLPSGLLWHPIQRAFKIELPSFNENLFEVKGELTLDFVPSSGEQKVAASKVKLDDLVRYVDTVPNHQFNALSWCVLEGDHALVFGDKVLPIVSERYWKFRDVLIPVGYDLKYSFLKQIIADFQSNAEKEDYWVFNLEGDYFSIPKDQLKVLNRPSVKVTREKC